MYNKPPPNRKDIRRVKFSSNSGFSIILAVGLMLLFSSIAAFGLKIFSMSNQNSGTAIIGMQTYFAAKAGLEWAIYKITNNASACFSSPSQFNLPAGTTGNNNYTITISCQMHTITDSSDYNIFQVQAAAEHLSPGATDYARKVLSAELALRI